MAERWEEAEWLKAAERRVRAVAEQVGLEVHPYLPSLAGWVITLPGEVKMHFVGFLRAVTLWRAEQMGLPLLAELMPMLKRDLTKLREPEVLILTPEHLAWMATRPLDEAVS